MEDYSKQNRLSDIEQAIRKYLIFLTKYKVILFIVVVALVYGYILYQINILSNKSPSTVSVQANTSPNSFIHINSSEAQKLNSLNDNSVNVQTLFSQARNNPFQD